MGFQLAPASRVTWKYDWLYCVFGTPEGSQRNISLGFLGFSARLVSRCACVEETRTGGVKPVADAPPGSRAVASAARARPLRRRRGMPPATHRNGDPCGRYGTSNVVLTLTAAPEEG